MKRLPMNYLSHIKLVNRGVRYGVVTKDAYGIPNILAFTCIYFEFWYLFYPVDHLMRVYHMSDKCGVNLTEDSNSDLEKLELHIP